MEASHGGQCALSKQPHESMELRYRARKKVSPLNIEDLINLKELLDIFY